MMRRHVTFGCEGAVLAGTVDGDLARARAVLLIVSGGNEVRAGAWSGQALLAAEIAADGFAALRFDRRGVGDSEGLNTGYRGSGADLAAAVAYVRGLVPQARIVAMGNCDAATALMLSGGAGVDGLILCNPWTLEGEEENASEEARAGAQVASLRAHYRARLANPAALWRLVSGKVSWRGLVGSILAMARSKSPQANGLAERMAASLARFSGPVAILIAGRDRTARAFLESWDKGDARIAVCDGAGHSFVEDEAREWLLGQVLQGLKTV